MRIRELHTNRALRNVRVVQCLYPSVRYRANCRAHVLRLAHGAVHTPDHRADLLTDGAFPARIPVATGDCRHGRDIQLEGFIRTFPTDPLRFLHLHVLCALLHQPVHLPGSRLQEDQLDDDALFRHQFYPADVYLHISLYAGKDIRLCVQHYVGRTLQHQYADPKKAVRNISGNLPTFFADVDLSVGSGCRYRSKRAARTYRSHVS